MLAIAVLLLRFSISQMDVPSRQSYTMAMVEPDERSTAAGVTGIARTTGAAVSPSLAGPLLQSAALMGLPGDPVRLADEVVAQVGEEADKLFARDGGEGRVVVEEGLELGERDAVVGQGVRAQPTAPL